MDDKYIKEFAKNANSLTFAEFIGKLFEGKFIEIYMGDSYEELSIDQVSTSYPSVFCGRVICGYKECLIINSFYIDKSDKKNKKAQIGNIMFINERAIRVLNEIDGKGVLEDMFMPSRESMLFKDQ